MHSFGERLAATFVTNGHLCIGIDPHPFLLEQWGLPDSEEGLREFGLRIIEATAGTVGIVKPQVAFFERHGSVGYAALEAVLTAARDAELIVIADVKRGDVGSSVTAYGEAWLTPGSTLEADAMTISAYQGVGSISGPIALAESTGKGLFVLAATSNPEAVVLQTAVIRHGPFSGETVAAGIVGEVHTVNTSSNGMGSIGLVLGATVSVADYGIRPEHLANTPILGPGFGEQGAAFGDISRVYGAASSNVIVSVSRGVLRSGSGGVAVEIARRRDELAEAMGT